MSDRIAVIGAGMMGGAIVKSLLKSGYKGKVTAADFMADKLKNSKLLGAVVTDDNKKAAAEADIVFVAVKPGDLEKVLKEISKEVAGKLVVSTAATVPLAFIKKNVPQARGRPNHAQRRRPCAGIIHSVLLRSRRYSTGQRKSQSSLEHDGHSEEMDEKYMDAITGLSGSGPGYLSIIVEALTYAGLKVGLPRNVAEKAAAQSMLGTAKLILDLPEHPAKIRDMVTTPGGTTIEAIYELEASQVRQALMRAVEAATKKSA